MSCSDKRSFRGKVAIITGSSSGIGAGTAVEFSRRGARLTITGRSVEGLRRVAEECRNVSPSKHEPLCVVAELSNTQDVEKIFRETIQKYGRLDILVNNAGIVGDTGNLMDQSLESFDRVVAVNMRAPFYLTKLAIPELEKTKGCIVNVSTAGSVIAIPQYTTYVMSKSAVDHFTRCAAVDLGPKGIRVNGINPGFVPTNLARDIDFTVNVQEMLEGNRLLTPLRKIGSVEEIAMTIAFLASEEASFITGASLFADGGCSLTTQMQ